LLGYKASYLHFPHKKPKATLVCFHGWLDNAASFIPLAELLTDYEIYAWDFIGHGKSAHKHAGERYHFVDLVPFVDAAIQSIGRKDIILVGHSMGAGASALYAGSVGECIQKLILIEGGVPITETPKKTAEALGDSVRFFRKSWQSLKSPVYKNFGDMVKIRMRINSLSQSAAHTLVKRAAVKTRGGYKWRADFRLRAPSLVRLTDLQVMDIVQKITVPTLVVLATQGIKELKIIVDKKNKLFPRAKLNILEGHHHLHMEKPVALVELMDNFICL